VESEQNPDGCHSDSFCGDPKSHHLLGEITMKLPRRQFLHLAAATTALSMTRIASALEYPTRPVRIIVGFAAGGVADIETRVIAQHLSERFGQRFIVENRTGASANIATEAVVNAAPDGYTLLCVTPSNAVNDTLYEKLSFKFDRDIAPIAGIMRAPNIMSVHPSFPIRSVPEFIAYTKANPGRVNFGSGGGGTSVHLAAELFMMLTGVNMVHVPYRGEAPALVDLLGGHVQVVFGTMPASLEYVKAGTLRALAVTTAARSDLLPDIPALGEFVANYESSVWIGLGAPKNTPTEIINSLNKHINSALADPRMNAQLAGLGGTALGGSPADFGKLIGDETEKWAKVIKFAGIKPE
jgi:tripartite-type tricarboxylate transporter receptor subunit TctC